MSAPAEPSRPTPPPLAEEAPAPDPGVPVGDHSPFAPLRQPVYRMLWSVVVVANVCMWMSDVASAWLMTSITLDPFWVALVQTAASAPVFLLGVPSGALADTLDRRRYLLFTQCWLSFSATLLFLAVVLNLVTVPLLLALTALNGVGLALRWPVYAALVSEAVPRGQLPQAMALSGVAMNMSRIIGPLLAGALIASAGIEWVFALNAVATAGSTYPIWRWKRVHTVNPLGREPLLGAMRVGLQYVGQSRDIRGLMLRVGIFFFHASATMALMPLLAKRLGGGAGTYSLLLACMGGGAIAVALLMPRLRRFTRPSQIIIFGALLQSISAVAIALSPSVVLSSLAIFVLGMTWLSTANSLTVSVQAALPDWVRARGMALYQMCIMGGGALGAAVWGQVAALGGLGTSLTVAAVSGFVCLWLAQRAAGDIVHEEDLSPSRVLRAPVATQPPKGQVVVSIEYLIDSRQCEPFLALMQESRRSRLRQGARSWSLLHDIARPGRFVEQTTDDSWTDHLRRFDRLTASDATLRERKLAYHLPEEPPQVTRYVIEDPP